MTAQVDHYEIFSVVLFEFNTTMMPGDQFVLNDHFLKGNRITFGGMGAAADLDRKFCDHVIDRLRSILNLYFN